MNVKSCEKKENNIAELVMDISAEEFDAALNEVYRKNRNMISVPGFRKGKAPRKIVENMYGATVFYEDAMEALLPRACADAVREKELNTVGYPDVKDVHVNDDKSVTVTFEMALYPEVTLGEYKGLKAVKPAVEVTDNDVQGEIEKIRLRNARIENVDRPAINGDTAIIDYDGYLDGVAFEGGHGENYELKLGSNTFIPGFEAKIQGMQVGEERDLDLTFPAEYHAENLAGKDVVFHVKLNELKSQVLPEADDEFAKDVSEFDTLAEYKDHLREDLKVQKEAQAQAAFENALLDKAVENMQADIPAALIDEYVEGGVENFSAQLAQYGMGLEAYLGMTGSNLEQFRESIRPQAEKQAKLNLTLEKIAEVEAIEPTDEEIEAEYADVAAQYGLELDDAKQQVDKAYVTRRVKLNKAQKLIAENGVVEEAPAEESAAAEEAPAEEAPAAEEKTEE